MMQRTGIVLIILMLAIAQVVHGDLVEATFPGQSAPSPEKAGASPTPSPAPAEAPAAPAEASAAPVAAVESKPPRTASASWWGWFTGADAYKEEKALARSEEIEQLRTEVSALRQEIKQLGETLDLMINRVMADLETENAQLREELRIVYGGGGIPLPPQVPRPGGELLDQVLSEVPLAGESSPISAPVQAPVTFGYSVLQEWGRSPQAAEELGGNAASLKGMVCVVPKGSQRVDLEAMGRDLRKQFAQFDNINIEVFDDEESAKTYAEQNKMNAAHRVLSVSKHQASGRDVILYYEGGATYEAGF